MVGLLLRERRIAVIFADSSFLVSRYLPNDRFSAPACTMPHPLPRRGCYPLLVELELTNTIWRAVGGECIPARLAANLLGAVESGPYQGLPCAQRPMLLRTTVTQ